MSPDLLKQFIENQMNINTKMIESIQGLNKNYSKLLQMIQETQDKLNSHIEDGETK